ncbi:ubiquitin conjugating enzyme family protein [Epithele typhae]|uniref:ubiquitin conjugating enzyme family protein n=1 Tax=Epithele typhae TaxID=378194 RepID=UPI002007C3BF|nr:ubiquitin conjugating enzyme family protein [Epithele typhae]KAH9939239.1 ubiquitin conjugating enzyme family protein [Epithele typhae]
MEREVQQLVDMGATPAQARAALKQHKDVMEAAERIFDGSFDHIVDGDGDVEMAPPQEATKQKPRMLTPNDDDDDEAEAEEGDGEDDEDEYIDYDSDYEDIGASNAAAVDPYAGIFFSKDRKEEVIEVEEEPEMVKLPRCTEKMPLMTQGQWMKGCPEGSEQSFLFSLYRELGEGSVPCPHGCGATYNRQKSNFWTIFPNFPAYIKHLESFVSKICSQCCKQFCFACGESSTSNHTKVAASLDVDISLFHCANLQGVILGVGLAMLEKSFVDVADLAAPKSDKTSRKRRKPDAPASHLIPTELHEDDDDDEDNYYPNLVKGKKPKLGTGYAGDVREDMSGQLEALQAQKDKDQKLATLLLNIRTFLPSVNREGGGHASDYLVHPTALAHLRRRFNFVSSQLLRNDSLTDMSDRSVLYFELFEWLETISSHEALASMMAMPIMVVTSVKTTAGKKPSPRGTPRVRERTIIYEGSSGPRELLEAIVIQAQAALKGLEGMKTSEPETFEMSEEQKRMTIDDKGKGKDDGAITSEENQKLLKFCQRIMNTAKAIDRSLVETKGKAFVDRLHAGLPKIPATSATHEDEVPIPAGQTEEEAQVAYVKWANRVRFEYCDLTIPSTEPATENGEDQPPNYKFYYNNEARMLANSDIPKRSLAIAKELAVLTTNLPVAWNSSIFLRVDETRVDVIKALITGPEGTPYYNGCYLFDVFLGPNYNQSPPSVKYMTTNGGKFRFNPNLYADGKVCLSLLGTWSGPGWIAGKSTLLQVLISIQSMILCDEPYLNEPGWANSGGTPKSIAYSANVKRMVVRTAMLGNLRNPPEPFGDVIRTHFRLKARSMIAQLDKWLAEDDGQPTVGDGAFNNRPAATGSSSNGFADDITELKTLFTRLEAGEDITHGAGDSS